MSAQPTGASPTALPAAAPVGAHYLSPPVLVGLACLLVGLVLLAGLAGLANPWLPGDEYIFLAGNPDVNPAAQQDALAPQTHAANVPWWLRIFFKVHDDLYQPLPILAYGLAWRASGGAPAALRLLDVLWHAANAVLLWWVLANVLRLVAGANRLPTTAIAWGLAAVWALHPLLVTTYAADMGGTHLLSAAFSLVALGCYLTALWPGRGAWRMGVVVALLLAMLCKPLPGWVLLTLVLEAARIGWRRAFISPLVWAVGVLCVASGALALYTSTTAGIVDEAGRGLFGDPVARAALALWIYARDTLAPLWLAPWYLPDPRTGWAYPLVWAGALVAVASIVHAIWAWRQPATRPLTIAWAWFWGLWLPVSGIVGARELAAADRYFYQPLMAVALAVGVGLMLWLRHRPAPPVKTVLIASGALALLLALTDLPHVRNARSAIARGQRMAALYPGDPRALEALAAAYDFARNHALPVDEAAAFANRAVQFEHFTKLTRTTLKDASAVPDIARYFPGAADCAPFHRRIAYRLLLADDPASSLAQAQVAAQLEPEAFMTWKRLAHAYQALGQYDAALSAYAECEARLPADARTRQAHFTDVGSLLLFQLERDRDACAQFAQAAAFGPPPPAAKLGLAVCEIRYGEGARGFALLREVIAAADAGDTQLALPAALAEAEYHLLSHHWVEAAGVYASVLDHDPTHYGALRGYYEVCLQVGDFIAAAVAWERAHRRAPQRLEFAAFSVWAQVLAGAPVPEDLAAAVDRDDPDNRFVNLARMVVALRADDPEAAMAHAALARRGDRLAYAQETARARAGIRLAVAQGILPASAAIGDALVLILADGTPEALRAGRERLAEYLVDAPASVWCDVGEWLLGWLSDVDGASGDGISSISDAKWREGG